MGLARTMIAPFDRILFCIATYLLKDIERDSAPLLLPDHQNSHVLKYLHSSLNPKAETATTRSLLDEIP
jgi:hypothetical protein